ncbi:hypothetical protein D8674_041396 [Pyrus ussuriensis x Pyrus communis]|uniref:Serine hydroxymethyltransferase-like domain-containing protein n=1 Tax=Pyrus ussuriensis x Pyrus communis TaxID=2448454 RepID=A0A5N5FST0_9ROSA|nr:hypothetical protein D8674_041396 [Pyrus ussuriensis x Pyrus communis]
MASLPSLIDAAIERAFATKLPAYFDKFRNELHSRSVGEGISAPLATDHYVSPAIEPIQLPRSPICVGGVQSQLILAAIQAPPLLSSSPLLRALATSTVKPQSNDSVATTFSLPASKTVIHASTMTIAPWPILKHSFPDTTKTGSERLNTDNMSLSSNLDAWDIVEDVAIAYEYTKLIRLEIARNVFTEVLTFILGSSITVVGSSHYAHEEYVSQLAKLRWGDRAVMVSQFMDELQTHGGQPCDNLGRELFWEKQPHMMQLGEDYAERMLSKFLDLIICGNFEFQTATLLQLLKPLWNIVRIRDESTPIDYIHVASSDKFLSWVDHHFPDIYSCGSIFQITILPPTLGPFLSRLDHSLKGFIWRTLFVELFKPTPNSKYKWNELSHFQNVEFYHVAKAIEKVGVRWIALPPASILFLLIHGMLFKEVVRLAETKQYYVDNANLSDALPLNQRKSLIAQTLNFLEVIFRDVNNHNNSGKHCDGEDSAACFHFKTLYTGDISPFEYADMVKTTTHKSPSNFSKLADSLFKKGYDIVSVGTENHLVLVNLRDKGIDGSRAEKVLESIHIAAITNNVPGYVFVVVPVGVLSIESPFSFETIVGVEGLEIDKGYIFPQFATNPEKLFVEFENAGVPITDQKISRMFKVVEDCRVAGILVMVITGDNQNIAEAICREIGVFSTDEDVHSRNLTGKEFMRTIRDPKAHLRQGDGLLFSRVEPKHIVRLLKEDGEVAAITVDGMNGASTLKLADIGIVMTISGTEVLPELKESAAAFKQVPTIFFLSLEDKANFQGGSIVMYPICN